LTSAALTIDLIAMVLIFVAVVRIVTTDRERFAHGRLSKTTWVIAALCLVLNTRHGDYPFGALFAIWHVRSITRRPKSDRPDVPFADGEPVPFRAEERS
jgi:hypothetical protein